MKKLLTTRRHLTSGVAVHDEGHDDHHLSSRRRFLRQLGLLTTGTVLLPGSAIEALGSSALVQALIDNPSDRILVLIRLKGGNDGLNTIIPVYDYSTYRNARPQIGYTQNNLLALNAELAVGSDFSGAHDLWTRGDMRVINGVGYPDHNLSHFRSTDILTSASNAQQVLTSGWLGRHLDNCFPDYLSNPPAAPPAIQIGGAGSLTFTNDENVSLAVTVSNIDELTKLAETGELYDTFNLPDCLYGEQLGYLRGVANSAFVFAGGIEAAYERGVNAVAYPGGELSDQLSLVARLIKGGLETRIFMVTLEGFDTHAGQTSDHAQLLQQLGDSVKAFHDDLIQSDDEKRVVTTTFSEFGRRIEENISRGTDHGTAAPQLIFGSSLNGNGSHGDLPDLNQPDSSGNLQFTTDFRSVYATLLEQWLCIPPASVDDVLGGTFSRLDLGFDCVTVGTSLPRTKIEGVRLLQADGGWAVSFESVGGNYKLELVDTNGRVLHQVNHQLPAGLTRLPLQIGTVASGVYAYRLSHQSGSSTSGMVPLIR